MTTSGLAQRTKVETLLIKGRITQGVRIVNLKKEEDRIASVAVIHDITTLTS